MGLRTRIPNGLLKCHCMEQAGLWRKSLHLWNSGQCRLGMITWSKSLPIVKSEIKCNKNVIKGFVKFIFCFCIYIQLISCNGQTDRAKKDINKTQEKLTTSGKSIDYKPLDSFKADTIAYMEYNFAENKKHYENTTLSKFFNHLEIPIHNFSVALSNTTKDSTDVIIFHFYNDLEVDHRYQAGKNPLIIYVRFTKPMSFKMLNKLSNREELPQITKVWSNKLSVI